MRYSFQLMYKPHLRAKNDISSLLLQTEPYISLPIVPSGPPLSIKAQDITDTSMKLIWSPPQQKHRNGIIILYGVCYQEASLGTECTDVTSIPGSQLSYEITEGLRPHCEYMFVVMAATKVAGWSPKAVLRETTLQAGKIERSFLLISKASTHGADLTVLPFNVFFFFNVFSFNVSFIN